MPTKRVPMLKIKEVLRLKYESGLSYAKIARACNLSKGAVAKYISLASAQGISWPLPQGVDEQELERRLYPDKVLSSNYAQPDCAHMHHELKRKGVTLQLLWSEYAANHGDSAYRYTQYCHHYRQWRSLQKRSMRQVHIAGEKLFIDYCGPTVTVVDQETGEALQAQIFVAVMGASSYTYAEATWSQRLPDWIASHQRTLQFLGGVPELLVPDNLRSAVSKPCRYAPEPNETYQELARHYSTAILPARPYKPQDKSKAEIGVQVVERWILARLRHHTFFSLGELNDSIRALLIDLNNRPFQKIPGSRQSHFESLDKPALKNLPTSHYEYAEWKQVKPGIDYHVEVGKHYYSVPHRLVGRVLDARTTSSVVEVFDRGQRVASHVRSHAGGFSTIKEHMPKSHLAHKDWSPRRFLHWGEDIGPCTLQTVHSLLENRPHPEHGYRACLGLLNLSRRYGKGRLEAACERALSIHSPTYRSVNSILKRGLDKQTLTQSDDSTQEDLPTHTNVRGSSYYH